MALPSTDFRAPRCRIGPGRIGPRRAALVGGEGRATAGCTGGNAVERRAARAQGMGGGGSRRFSPFGSSLASAWGWSVAWVSEHTPSPARL